MKIVKEKSRQLANVTTSGIAAMVPPPHEPVSPLGVDTIGLAGNVAESPIRSAQPYSPPRCLL